MEDKIFSVTKDWTSHERASILRDYRVVKVQRSQTSLKAAELFMQLSPEERGIATSEWKKTSEGQRKARGSGVRGD